LVAKAITGRIAGCNEWVDKRFELRSKTHLSTCGAKMGHPHLLPLGRPGGGYGLQDGDELSSSDGFDMTSAVFGFAWQRVVSVVRTEALEKEASYVLRKLLPSCRGRGKVWQCVFVGLDFGLRDGDGLSVGAELRAWTCAVVGEGGSLFLC
jgi:hypothetical protein